MKLKVVSIPENFNKPDRAAFFEWTQDYLAHGWSIALSDIHRDGSNEGLMNVNNLTEAAIRRIGGGVLSEKTIRLITLLRHLVKSLKATESKARKLEQEVCLLTQSHLRYFRN